MCGSSRPTRTATFADDDLPTRVMRALLLGGTTFLGRHLVRALLARGHAVATFTRGRARPDPELALERYVGDRDGAFGALPRDGWDAVVDTSAHWPRLVAASAAHLARAGRYVYVSSISVYDCHAPEIGAGLAPYATMPDGTPETDGEAYGPLKRRSEDVARAVFGERALVVRPGLIVGPYDPTDRFTYWVERFAAGGAALVPGPPHRYVQFVDARDVADFIVTSLERGATGTYDVTGRPRVTTMGDVVDALRDGGPASATPAWVDGAALEARGLEGWVDLPLWVAPGLGFAGLMNANVNRALADGLRLRPLRETIADTRAWAATRAADEPRAAGIAREREHALLDAG